MNPCSNDPSTGLAPVRAANGEMVWPWRPTQEDWDEAVKSYIKRWQAENGISESPKEQP